MPITLSPLSCPSICKSFKCSPLFQSSTFAKEYQKSTWSPKCQILCLDLWFRWIMCKSSWGVKMHTDSSYCFMHMRTLRFLPRSVQFMLTKSEMSPAFRQNTGLRILLIFVYYPTILTFEALMLKEGWCEDHTFLKMSWYIVIVI